MLPPPPSSPKFIDANLYQKILHNIPVLTVDVLLLDRLTHEYVLVKRVNEPLKNVFMTPGGRVFKNESLASAATRICHAETGLSISTLNWSFLGLFEGMWSENAFNDPSFSTHTVSILFGSRLLIDSSKIVLDKQSSEWKLSNILPDTIYNSLYATAASSFKESVQS